MDVLKIKKLDPRAIVPLRATPGSACIDLHALLDAPLILEPGMHCLIHSGLSIEMPSSDCVALIFSRSGMGIKHGITLSNSVGVIDSDYRGELCIGLVNHGKVPYTIQPNDRVAQLMVIRHLALQVEVVDELEETERGSGGFGSTGSN
jgi:dUTP pyrophosphatase